ncbi:unnamed protein product [Urochloa decumbens]|uniref:DUF7595 domain-containing protein n=1 Tax=Urochloa decumbens TaxID=240449 RepID=A0ABC9AZX5_9POAL
MPQRTWTAKEILGEVFRRLNTATDLVNSAGTCKPWRRAIIDNASSLRPHPNRFNPNLLLGFFYRWECAFLQRVLGPFHFALPAITGSEEGHYVKPCDIIPAENTGGVNLALYNWLLSSRDGFLLLKSLSRDVVDLCLCNPMTGACTFLPTAAFRPEAYVLITGYDVSVSECDDMAVRIRIVAVKSIYDCSSISLQYQHFCSTSWSGTGSWGPVMRSDKIKKQLIVDADQGTELVCGSTIYWLGHSTSIVPAYSSVAAMDVCTGRTRTIELPKQCRNKYNFSDHVLAMTSDGRLSLLRNARRCRGRGHIQVWVHNTGAQWFVLRTIKVPNLCFQNGVFWPRSGCLLAEEEGGQQLLINIETGSSRPITCPYATVSNEAGFRYPYEMDWSTYLSMMNPFVTATVSMCSN